MTNGYLTVPLADNTELLILGDLNELMIIGMLNVLTEGYHYSSVTGARQHDGNYTVNMIYAASAFAPGTPMMNTNLIDIANYTAIGQYYGALCLAYENSIERKEQIKVFLMPLGSDNTQAENNLKKAIELLEEKYKDKNYNANKLNINLLM